VTPTSGLPTVLGAVPFRTKGQSKPVPPRFREAVFADYPQIADLESRYGLHPKSYEEWTHLWVHNPAYCNFRHWPIGWVCENEHDEIVGSIGNIPLAFEFDNRPLVAATSRGLVVDLRYRAYAFTLLSHFFGQKDVDLFLNTSVNEKVSRLHQAFRALRVPSGTWDRASFWITDYAGFSTSLLYRKEFSGPRMWSYPLAAGLFVRDRLTNKIVRAADNPDRVEYCTQFDERFDQFWQQLRKRGSGCLLADRSREALEWHFKYALQKGEAWLLTISQGAKLAAYAILCRQDNVGFSLKRMRLVDFQSLDESQNGLRPLLAFALEKCQGEGIHMMEAIGFSPDKQRIIDSMNPHYRELSSWRYFYRTDRSSLSASLSQASAWDPTCYDGDSSL
jgi:hypothetical protein